MADGGSCGGDRDYGSDDWSRGDNLRVVGSAEVDTKLVWFDTDNPSYVRNGVTVRGLTGGDTKLIGIDYRVQDGKLYGVGNNTPGAGVYSIDPGTGTATSFTPLTVARRIWAGPSARSGPGSRAATTAGDGTPR